MSLKPKKPRKIVDYQLCWGNYDEKTRTGAANNLSDVVRGYLERGWELHGETYSIKGNNGFSHYQAVVRYE